MQSKAEVESYKKYLKDKLLLLFKDEDNFSQIVQCMNSSNVQQFSWKIQVDKDKIARQLVAIQSISSIPAEERAEFQLTTIVEKNRSIGYCVSEKFVQLLLEKKGNIKEEDLAAIGLNNQQIRTIQRYFLSKDDWKNWCNKYKNHISAHRLAQNQDFSSGSNVSDHFNSSRPPAVDKKFEKDLQQEKLAMNYGQDKTTEQEKRRKHKYLKSKIEYLSKNYPTDLLQIKLLNIALNLMVDPQFQVRVDQLKTILTDEKKQKYQKIQQKFQQYHDQRYQVIAYETGKTEIEGFIKILAPIDTFQIDVASKSTLPKQKSALMIIGDTGVGKTTLICRLLNYEFKQGFKNKKETLILKGQYRKEHDSLIASADLSSVTQSLSAFEFSYKNFKTSLIDSPGFNDTHGVERDISNQILLEKAYESCESICYLYLVDICNLKGRGIMTVALAKNIASRFDYNSKKQLQNMLLLVFNTKNASKDHQVDNIPVQTKEFLKQNQYILYDKQKWALQLIIDRLDNKFSRFQVMESVEELKKDISKLTFQKKNRILRKIDSSFESKVDEYNKILKDSICQCLQSIRVNHARYYYDQLCILQSKVGHQSTKLTKLQLDAWIKQEVGNIQGRLKSILSTKIATLLVKNEEFQDFIRQVNDVKPFIEILKLDEVMSRIDTQINKTFQSIISQINNKATDESITMITRICGYFLTSDVLKPKIIQNESDIEKNFAVQLQELPKQIVKVYKNDDWQGFDSNFKSYSTFYKFYQSFNTIFGQKFNRLNSFKSPEDLRNYYYYAQSKKLAAFLKSLESFENSFNSNQPITSENISLMNKLFDSLFSFKKSVYISLEKEIQSQQAKIKESLNHQCTLYSQDLQRILQFNESLGEKHVEVQTFVNNSSIIINLLNIDSIKGIVSRTKTAIISKLESVLSEIRQQLNHAKENIRNLQIQTQYRKLWNIKQKLSFFQIFHEEYKKYGLNILYDEFEKQFVQLNISLNQSLKASFFNSRPDTIKFIFQCMKSSKKYEKISEKINSLINKSQEQFDANVKKYMEDLKEKISIKQIRSIQDYKRFDRHYIQIMKNYINSVLLYSYRQSDCIPVELHEQIYFISNDAFSNIDYFIDTCISIGNNIQNQQQIKVQENQRSDIDEKLRINYQYINVLGEIYQNLSKVTEKFIEYLRNQNEFKLDGKIEISQMMEKIQKFPYNRHEQIRSFQITTSNLTKRGVEGGTSSVASHRRIKIDKCNVYLQEIQKIKLLMNKINQSSNQDNKVNKDLFAETQAEIINLINFYNDRQLNRIQQTIMFNPLEIPYMMDCQNLYLELNSPDKIDTAGQNISAFKQRLEIFVHRKAQDYERKQSSCQDPLGPENILNLNEAISYFLSFKRFISKEDAQKDYKGIFEKLDKVIRLISQQVQVAIEGRIRQLQEKVEQRIFDQMDKDLLRLEKIIKKMKEYFSQIENNSSKQLSDSIEQSLELKNINKALIDIANIRKGRENQMKMDQKIAEKPFEGINKFKLQESFTKAKGQVQHRMRENIEKEFRELLNRYQMCPYSESNKIGKQITEKIHYIPFQLSKSHNYLAQYETLRDRKLLKERTQLDKLKSRQNNILNNENLNKLLIKYHEFSINQNLQMKEQALEVIKNELNLILLDIVRAENIFDKIEIARKRFWSLSYNPRINQREHVSQDITNHFITIENEISEGFSKLVNKSIGYLSKIINDEQLPSFDIDEIQNYTDIINCFYHVFEEKKQKTHFEENYKKMCQQIQEIIKEWQKNFQIVCPLDKLEKTLKDFDMNISKIKKLLKRCLAKTSIYSIIFKQNSSSRKYFGQESPMIDMAESSQSQILLKINIFREATDANIKQLKYHLSNIEFQHYVNFNRQQIEKMLTKADKYATMLEIYQQSFASNLFGYEFQETNLQSIVKSIQGKLNTFVNKVLNSLSDSFQSLEKQIPNQLYFLEMLLEKISSNCCLKIFDNLANESQGSDLTYSQYAMNPSKKFDEFIEYCLVKMKPLITDARKQFCSLTQKQTAHKTHRNEYEDRMRIPLNKLYLQYQENLNKIAQMNEGKSDIEIQHKQKELNDLFQLNCQNEEERWNQRWQKIEQEYIQTSNEIKKKYVSLLLNLKKLQFNFHPSNSAKATISQMIKGELEEIKKAKMLRLLSENLEEYNFQNYALLLKSDSLYFKFEQYIEFNKKTEAQGIGYVTNELKTLYQILQNKYFGGKDKKVMENIKNDLKIEYGTFKTFYFSLLKENQMLAFENRIEIIAEKYKQSDRVKRIAIILAVWSLFEKSKNIDTDDIILNGQQGQTLDINPHPVQVAALLLLTKPDQNNQIKSQLAQILTGEGKSIVLVTLAIFFARQNISVIVSCYSSYLCKRDLKNFHHLFVQFKVNHLISYNTFNEICEKVLNNPQQNTQQTILQIIKNEPVRNADKIGATKSKKSILLIDEVDVFFEKEFFGSPYRPAIKLKDEISKNFIKYVFEELEKNSKTSVKDLLESKQFKKLISFYPKIEIILQNQLHRMKNEYLYPMNRYQVDQKMIKYKDKDKLSQKLHFGYQTIFAYCKEFKNGRISPENYENALFIPLIYGQFSYSQLPKCYSNIIGLSGTIQHLPAEKINYLVNDYKIDKKNMYILPSIYGAQHKKIEAFTVKNQREYNQFLIQMIIEELKKGRPVLVCFKTYKEMEEFYKSKHFVDSKLKFASLHEHLDNDLRDKCIMTVGTPSRLTLMTSEFARGTDFIISDKKIKKNGGLHLILTYIPDLLSEFIQFRGRTGRQGQDGSIHAIITETQAKQKEVPTDYDQQEILSNMVMYMDKVSSKQDEQNKKKLEENLKNHVETQKYLQNLSRSVEQYILFLFNLNKVIVTKDTPTKIVIGIDGTNSMQKTFDQLIRQLQIIMTRIVTLQKQPQQLNGSFLVQVVVYRNYNSGDQILQASDFQQNLELLQPFLSKIKVEGGMGNEAIEMLYRHINLQGDVDMVILIGDAPPNTEQNVRRNRKDDTWVKFLKKKQSKNPLYYPTNCNQEQKRFSQEIIINGLYINGNKYVESKSAQAYFKEVAERHKGEAKELNFNRPDYSENLVQFFTTKILAAVNGNENQQKINQMYRNKFRTYTS